MTVAEMIKLAQAGYKAGEIKDLMKLEKEELEAKTSLPAEAVEVKPSEPEITTNDVKPDFEALYKQAMVDMDQIKKELNAAQLSNQSAGSREAVQQFNINDEFKKAQDLFRR